MQDVELDKMDAFRTGLIDYIRKNDEALYGRIEETRLLSDEDRQRIIELSKAYKES